MVDRLDTIANASVQANVKQSNMCAYFAEEIKHSQNGSETRFSQVKI